MPGGPPPDAVARRLERERRARRESKAIAEDITRQLYDTVRQLQRSRAVLDETTDFVAITDLDGTASYVNRALRELLGHVTEHAEEPVNLFEVLTPASRERMISDAVPTVMDKGVWRGELAMVVPTTGSEIPVSQVLIGHRGPDGVVEGLSAVSRDITDRLAVERQLTHLALHDALTGLPNRRLLFDRLDVALARADRSGEALGVLFIDLDGFKPINDIHGHDVGDEVLVIVARRIAECLRPSDTVARLGGDEFAVLCEHVMDRRGAGLVAERVADSIARPIVTAGLELSVTASIGVTLTRTASERDPAAVLRIADAAMYRAKQAGKARYHIAEESA